MVWCAAVCISEKRPGPNHEPILGLFFLPAIQCVPSTRCQNWPQIISSVTYSLRGPSSPSGNTNPIFGARRAKLRSIKCQECRLVLCCTAQVGWIRMNAPISRGIWMEAVCLDAMSSKVHCCYAMPFIAPPPQKGCKGPTVTPLACSLCCLLTRYRRRPKGEEQRQDPQHP